MAATLAGLSVGKVPDLDGEVALPDERFSVTQANLAESSGLVTCAMCQEMEDSLDLTPVGLCLRCADRDHTVRAAPHSNRFWILSPREIRRVEVEIRRLTAELDRMNQRFIELERRRIAEGDRVYHRTLEAERDRWHTLQRELHLLHLLRAASRQFGG
jgi:hypothetical protein